MGKKTVYLDRKVKNIRQVGKKHYLTTKTNVDNKNEQFSEENGCLFVFTHVQLWALQAVNLKDMQQRLYVVLNLVAIKGVPQDPQAFWYGMCQNYTDLKADSQVLSWADCAVIFHKWHLLSNNYKFLGHAG